MATRRDQWLAWVLLLVSLAASSPTPSAERLKIFALEDLIPLKPDFHPQRTSGFWVSETDYVFSESGRGLQKYKADTGEIVGFLTDDDMRNLSKNSISSFSKDGRYILVAKDRRKIYRYSSVAQYSVYDLENKTLRPLGKGPLQVCVWSTGDDTALVYVRSNNVYYVPDVTEPEKVRQLTTDGVPGEIYNGVADWIYEEEIFNSAITSWFSSEGTYLAVASFNDSAVEWATFPYYGRPSELDSQYPEIVYFKYPKPGRTNPKVKLMVYSLEDAGAEPKAIPAPEELVGPDPVLGSVHWAADHSLVVQWLNRRQNISVLVNCNMGNETCDMVQKRIEPNGWIDVTEPLFTISGQHMFDLQPLPYGGKRYPHIAQFDFETLNTKDLSPGNSSVMDILGWHENTGTLLFLVSPGETPWKRQVWSSQGGVVECVTCALTDCDVTMATFAPGAGYAVFMCSDVNVPFQTFIYNTQTRSSTLWKDNKPLENKLSEYVLPQSEFQVLKLSDDVVAHVQLLLPPNYQDGAKHPMIVKIYAGPRSAKVVKSYELDYSTYLVSNRSYVVCYVDVRGSGAMGTEAMHAINNALGTVEVNDTLNVIRKLVAEKSYIDPKRVGVWGWSYGGYTTAMMLAYDNQNTLTCGAAIAPVTSWLYYDSIYTERYMDIPSKNTGGYRRSDLLLVTERLRGRKLLLVHGSADDNVHYQHSMLLAKQLQHADIEFEQMSYADENHSLMGVSRHFYHTLDHFWSQCFA